MLVSIWRKGKLCTSLLRMHIGAPTMENSMDVPQKDKKIELPYDLAILLLSIYPKELESGSQKDYVHPHVHCNIIHNCQDMEATYMSMAING